MPYNFAADSFHAKKLCSRLSLSEVRFSMEISRVAFLRSPLWDLGATYDNHLRLIGKRVLPISVNWTFFARFYGWGATSKYRFKIGNFAPMGAGWVKISGTRGRLPVTILLLRKVGEIIFHMVWKSGQIFVPFCQCTRLTDGQTENSHR